MLIRINSGKSGIKEYLEEGQKQDRFYSRDELDQRVILNGDLEVVDELIQIMDKNDVERSKYFHITLAFKEDVINEQVLKDISREFREFYFKAYNDDELHYYAEAHLPKIKSYVDAKTGEIIKRKPHIHVVVPTINLLTGNAINYYQPANLKHIDAFQEHINNKYGLASPKDNIRYRINDNSEFISRYKGDGFKGKNRDVREKIFDQIIAKNITSFTELQRYLKDDGYSIKIRNEGQGGDKEYINIIDKNGVSINLRDKVFKREFLELSSTEKMSRLRIDNAYIEPVVLGNKLSDRYESLLQEWGEIKAYEYKYITASSSQNEREKFNKLPLAAKKEFIQLKQKEFKQTYYGVNNDGNDGTKSSVIGNREHGSGNIEQEYFDTIEQNVRAANDAIQNTRNNLRGIIPNQGSFIGRERRWGIAERYARIIGGNQADIRRNPSQYQSNQDNIGSDNEKARKCNPIDDEYQQLLTKLNLNRGAFKDLVNKFNTEIQADVLLELLEKTHGAIPELYRITKTADGSDRVGCGTRNLNMMDFCLKEMNLSLAESHSILSNALNMQMEVNRERGWSHDKSVYLSEEYAKWFKDYKAERVKSVFEHKDSFKNKREAIVTRYTEEIATTRANEKLPYKAKRERINVLKVDKLLELEALKKAKYAADVSLKSQYNLEMQKAYRVFLARRARENDELALIELRRLRIDFDDQQNTNSFNYVDRYQEFKLNITHVIDDRGVINYQINGKTIIQDHGKRVSIVNNSDENTKMILELAKQKFGMNITLTGSDKFRQRAVDIAIKNNFRINFTDNFSKKYQKQRIDEYKLQFSQLNDAKVELIQDKPKVLYVGSVRDIGMVNDDGRYTSMLVVNVVDPRTKKSYDVSGYKVNFIANKLTSGQFVDFIHDEERQDVNLKPSNVDKAIKNLIVDSMSNDREEFITQLKLDYKIDSLKCEYSGKLIRVGEIKGKFYALVAVDGEVKRIWNNDLKVKIKELGITKGDYISIAVPQAKMAEITTKSKSTAVTRTNKPVFDDLFLDIDLLVGRSQYKKDYCGRIKQIKAVKLKSGRESNVVVIDDILLGKPQIVYMDNVNALKLNDFVYLGEKSFNNFEVVDLNKKLQARRDDILGEQNVEGVLLGEITQIGTKIIKNKDVYFVEFKTDEGMVIKYGEQIQDEIEKLDLKVGDSIVITSKENTAVSTKEVNIIEVKQLGINVETIVHDKINTILDEIERNLDKSMVDKVHEVD